MPFYGHTGIPDPTAPDKTVAGIVRKWSVAEGAFTSPDQRIATVDVAGRIYGLVICFPALIDRLYASEGSTVPADDFILKWTADGESIPYGRAFFRLETSDA
jgi:hypothetical protein